MADAPPGWRPPRRPAGPARCGPGPRARPPPPAPHPPADPAPWCRYRSRPGSGRFRARTGTTSTTAEATRPTGGDDEQGDPARSAAPLPGDDQQHRGEHVELHLDRQRPQVPQGRDLPEEAEVRLTLGDEEPVLDAEQRRDRSADPVVQQLGGLDRGPEHHRTDGEHEHGGQPAQAPVGVAAHVDLAPPVDLAQAQPGDQERRQHEEHVDRQHAAGGQPGPEVEDQRPDDQREPAQAVETQDVRGRLGGCAHHPCRLPIASWRIRYPPGERISWPPVRSGRSAHRTGRSASAEPDGCRIGSMPPVTLTFTLDLEDHRPSDAVGPSATRCWSVGCSRGWRSATSGPRSSSWASWPTNTPSCWPTSLRPATRSACTAGPTNRSPIWARSDSPPTRPRARSGSRRSPVTTWSATGRRSSRCPRVRMGARGAARPSGSSTAPACCPRPIPQFGWAGRPDPSVPVAVRSGRASRPDRGSRSVPGAGAGRGLPADPSVAGRPTGTAPPARRRDPVDLLPPVRLRSRRAVLGRSRGGPGREPADLVQPQEHAAPPGPALRRRRRTSAAGPRPAARPGEMSTFQPEMAA